MDKELEELFIKMITVSPLAKDQKQQWLERLRAEGPSTVLLNALQKDMDVAAAQAQGKLQKELEDIEAQAEKIEREFDQDYKEVTDTATSEAKEHQVRQDQRIMEELRRKLAA